MQNLKIDKEFKALIPPLSEEEFCQLEENILTRGCRDAIITWNSTIIDGHNRYAICQKHGISYREAPMRFASRKAAVLWILENQLGRRNLTDAVRISLAMRKDELSQTRKHPTSNRKKIASEANVSEQTVHKYMKIKALGDQKLLEQVNTGELKIGTAYKKLQVSTRTVQELLTPAELKELNRQFQKTAVLNCIGGIERLYNFISKNIPIEEGKKDVDLIQKRLEVQLRTISKL